MKAVRKWLRICALMLGILVLVQGCRDDDELFQVVVIDTQEELEKFVLDNNSRIEEDVILSGNITSLEVFSTVQKIIGDLAIIDTRLTTLDGLENLILVTGDITITSTPPNQQGITDFCALQNLLERGSFKSISITNNIFNPTVSEILEGNCRL